MDQFDNRSYLRPVNVLLVVNMGFLSFIDEKWHKIEILLISK